MVGIKYGVATMENSMEVPKKTKNRATIWFWNLTPGHTSNENYNLERYMHLNIHCNSVYNSQAMEKNKMSTDRRMDKEDVVHICSGISLSHYK